MADQKVAMITDSQRTQINDLIERAEFLNVDEDTIHSKLEQQVSSFDPDVDDPFGALTEEEATQALDLLSEIVTEAELDEEDEDDEDDEDLEEEDDEEEEELELEPSLRDTGFIDPPTLR